jgi:single-strand DNA-binding protein
VWWSENFRLPHRLKAEKHEEKQITLNKTFLQGRMVADPELRHTPNGVAIASFRLAVERDYKENGEKKADFINVVAWRHTGEFVSKFFTKGRMAIVEGRLQIRDYTDRDGNRRTIAEVVADNVYFGDSGKEGDGQSERSAPPPGGGYSNQPGVDQFSELTDDDGELPF